MLYIAISTHTAVMPPPARTIFHILRVPIVVLVLLCAVGIYWVLQPAAESDRRLPGEFEQHQALVLAWEEMPVYEEEEELLLAQRNVLAEIAAATHATIQVVILVTDDESRQSAILALQERGVPLAKVKILDVPFDSIWIRDYGPIGVEHRDKRYRWLDFTYQLNLPSWTGPNGEHTGRPLDDELAKQLGERLNVPVTSVPLELHGGGIVSNGRGLVLVSSAIVEWNQHQYSYDEQQIHNIIREQLGATTVVSLQPLQGEPTGHLDIFVTFTSATDVVIGSYPTHYDPSNAARLNQHARRLAAIEIDGEALKVHRIPMPPRGRQMFGGTYLNVVYGNGVLVMPTYGIDPEGERVARETFERLLPGWRVVGVDCNPLVIAEGASHCVSLNIFRCPLELLESAAAFQ